MPSWQGRQPVNPVRINDKRIAQNKYVFRAILEILQFIISLRYFFKSLFNIRLSGLSRHIHLLYFYMYKQTVRFCFRLHSWSRKAHHPNKPR